MEPTDQENVASPAMRAERQRLRRLRNVGVFAHVVSCAGAT